MNGKKELTTRNGVIPKSTRKQLEVAISLTKKHLKMLTEELAELSQNDYTNQS